MTEVYNPLDKRNLGKSVADALLTQPTHRLDHIREFEGAGIYVIYYQGDLPIYRPMADANVSEAKWPIYIGKAIPSGGRKGASLIVSARGKALYKRIIEHRESIRDVEKDSGTLKVSDFLVRYLSVDDIWIPLGESLLIEHFLPVWNRTLDGFGNHDPGRGRYQGLRPLWDHFHPGRGWARRCRERSETKEDIENTLSKYLSEHFPRGL